MRPAASAGLESNESEDQDRRRYDSVWFHAPFPGGRVNQRGAGGKRWVRQRRGEEGRQNLQLVGTFEEKGMPSGGSDSYVEAGSSVTAGGGLDWLEKTDPFRIPLGSLLRGSGSFFRGSGSFGARSGSRLGSAGWGLVVKEREGWARGRPLYLYVRWCAPEMLTANRMGLAGVKTREDF
jgi:hypothetical protein